MRERSGGAKRRKVRGKQTNTQLYDRRGDAASLDEYQKVGI
jgi:hypothetical protein